MRAPRRPRTLLKLRVPAELLQTHPSQIHQTPPRLCWRTPSSRSGEQPGTVRVPSERKQKGEESRNLLPMNGVDSGSRCPRSGGHIRRVKRHTCTPGSNITRPGWILTLFLVQHHRPEKRGVLPRAIRPRLQEAGPFALAQSFSWKRLWNARLTRLRLDKSKPWKDESVSARCFPPRLALASLSKIIHRETRRLNAARSVRPTWAATRIKTAIRQRRVLSINSMRIKKNPTHARTRTKPEPKQWKAG